MRPEADGTWPQGRESVSRSGRTIGKEFIAKRSPVPFGYPAQRGREKASRWNFSKWHRRSGEAHSRPRNLPHAPPKRKHRSVGGHALEFIHSVTNSLISTTRQVSRCGVQLLEKFFAPIKPRPLVARVRGGIFWHSSATNGRGFMLKEANEGRKCHRQLQIDSRPLYVGSPSVAKGLESDHTFSTNRINKI